MKVSDYHKRDICEELKELEKDLRNASHCIWGSPIIKGLKDKEYINKFFIKQEVETIADSWVSTLVIYISEVEGIYIEENIIYQSIPTSVCKNAFSKMSDVNSKIDPVKWLLMSQIDSLQYKFFIGGMQQLIKERNKRNKKYKYEEPNN